MAVNKIEAEGGRLVCVLRSNEGSDAVATRGEDGEVHSSEEFLKLIEKVQGSAE